jgi:AraC family transcriptional regulator
MKILGTGQFFGETNKTIHLNGMTLTDTVYTHSKVDWHYHENAYFTFIINGSVIEGNKKEVYNCTPGSLLFHNWQEPHYNIKPDAYTRGFQIELKKDWFEDLDLDISQLQGSLKVANLDVKFLMYKIFLETNFMDNVTSISIQSLLIETLTEMFKSKHREEKKKPVWVDKIKEYLYYENEGNTNLENLSSLLDIHPVHLSRDFSKHFNCNLGQYIRKTKIEKSLQLLAFKDKSLTEVAYECGFSDQSHFNRNFKSIIGTSPLKYKKIILS